MVGTSDCTYGANILVLPIGLLCEVCSTGFTKQNDQCVRCSGAEWENSVKILAKMIVIGFLCVKLLEKAITRTYDPSPPMGSVFEMI